MSQPLTEQYKVGEWQSSNIMPDFIRGENGVLQPNSSEILSDKEAAELQPEKLIVPYWY